ncbi:DUF262 domain-containing protein [Asticcacaulis excentricus]|uniref:GmrSD restriction endonucleases N-terminal domain-containing protein n=1 Tax=Asticcacaulis excentricus (strain ATCC 15261 / DSM 4724 / KCTC 12464 / NCIMB 9791 / VKM B-1370 / CB 48) TaxID=573065 RepID=E8RW03_ASTEC|nr:DUF262 domain-containing protein [Asticcacaulis excentricus]ADU15425.1 protein of unknown function DUF262 [Asticcacaulis excentricus CB 48]
MVHWNISPHPIADVRDWSDAKRLELQPDFQRREVWAHSAKIMLIDSILSDIPLPKIFLAKTIKNGSVHRQVIDGQQRISAILGFLRNEFSLEAPYEGPHLGKRFQDFTPDEVDSFLRYRIDFNEADNPTDREVRDVYMRVNKYTVPLTKQELRRADYPGDFLTVSEELSVIPFFETAGIFSPTDRRRYADAEYSSELIAGLIDGTLDKKVELDNYYIKYTNWPVEDRKKIVKRFNEAIADIGEIFKDIPGNIRETRFRQKADFYSLFLAIDELRQEGHDLAGKDLSDLRDDIRLLDLGIRPEATVGIFSEYAIKCVSQANSASSRKWRLNFLKGLLSGTYIGLPASDAYRGLYYRVFEDCVEADRAGICKPIEYECPVCDDLVEYEKGKDFIGWDASAKAFQISNAAWVHAECIGDSGDLLIIERPVEGENE